MNLAALLFALAQAAAPVAPAPPPTPAVVKDPLAAPTFLGIYGWKEVIWQGVKTPEGGWTLKRGDAWGGRLVAGLGLGRYGLELRGDVSGLVDQFKVDDTATYQSIEVYGAGYWNAASSGGVQIGPMVLLGTVAAIDAPQYGGIGVSVAGAGVRVGAFGGEAHAFVAHTSNFLADDPTWRFGAAFHIPVMPPVYVVGDILTGNAGLVRVGIAARLK